MLPNAHFQEDQALKRVTNTSNLEKPQFNWRTTIENDRDSQPSIKIIVDGDTRDCDLGEIADTVGSALTNLLISRKREDIFTTSNREFVATVARRAQQILSSKAQGQPDATIHHDDVHLAIEQALIKNGAHDVAKSLLLNRRAPTHKTPNLRLIRRNGYVVPWNPNKIEIAVRKAFLSLHQDSGPAVDIARKVTEHLLRLKQSFVYIEDVQDLVQQELMKNGYYKVAEAYILYRAYRAQQRAREAESTAVQKTPHQDALIVLRQPDGSTTLWDGTDLRQRIAFANIGLDLCLHPEEIETELRRALYKEMSASDLQKTLILNVKSLTEKDADFAKFAARILLTYIYEEVLEWDILRDGIAAIKHSHRRAFRTYLQHGVRIQRLDSRLLDYDLDILADALDPSADLDFDYLGIQTLYDRYLIIDKTVDPVRRIETPQFFWMRVAMGLFLNEKKQREDRAIQLYRLYKSRRFCSSTPTLFNSGTPHSQLSSCYLYKVDDSLESIMLRGIAENAFLSKWAGGLGGSWTAVRGTGSHIKGTNGESQGVIPFLKLHNDQLVAVNQGGKRRGSGCAYLETWHNDIHDFLDLRRNTGDDRRRTHDMNTANWIPDLFMKRLEAREPWTLFRSNDVPELHELYGRAFEEKYTAYEKQYDEGKLYGTRLPALELWKSLLKMLFETGHPWITFKDPCNIRSPQDHVGVIHSSNLCTEITLNTSADETAVCNLGSLVLDTHLDDTGELDHEKLRSTIRTAIRALDNVIDLNYYPTEAAAKANRCHRPIGLGVMGLQNALYIKNYSFASPEAVAFNDTFMEAIAYYAYEASSDLAQERGPYSTYKGSKWDRGLLPQDTLDLLAEQRGLPIDAPRDSRIDWKPLRAKIKKHGMRNSNVLALAPTATISNIMGTTPCIEPTYKNLFVKSNLSGDFIVLNASLVRDLKRFNLWTPEMRDNLKYFDGELADIDGIPEDLKKKYLTAFAIDYTYLIDAAARRQKWIDQSQSVNLFLAEPKLKTLSHMYRSAWHKGLKTTYYLRTLGASNIEKATLSIKKPPSVLGAGASPEPSKKSSQSVKEAPSLPTAPTSNGASLIPNLIPDPLLNGVDDCEACQ